MARIAARRARTDGAAALAAVPPRQRHSTTVLYLVFFASGFSALLYQVIWQRVLAIFSGADVFSITIVVSAFMGGLGCGSLVGGWLADRLAPGRQIATFAAAELGIASFASISLWLYHDVLYLRFGHLAGRPTVAAIVLFLSLLLPTGLMGLSLPLLARAMTRDVAGAAARIGALYAVNTLGAAAGAFTTTWWCMRSLGFEGTVWLGAVINVLVATLAYTAYRWSRVSDAIDDLREPEARSVSAATAPSDRSVVIDDRSHTAIWLATYALSGFVALSLEIVWFRLLGVMLKSNAFTFGHLLAMYLAGLAAGTAVGRWWVERSTRPAEVFRLLQASVCLYGGLVIVALVAIVHQVRPVWEYLARYEPLSVSDAFGHPVLLAALYLGVPLVVIGPPTLMMGASFPFLQRVVQRDLRTLGRRVGWLQAANIFGAMLGAALTGWLALDVLGTSGTLRLLVLLGIAFLVPLGVQRRPAEGRTPLRGVATIGMVVLAGTAVAVPSSTRLWAVLHGTTTERVIHAEDASGLSLLKGDTPGFRGSTMVYANGLGQSEVPFPTHHVLLGMVPVLLHAQPQSIAIIGLGSGATLYAAGGRAETRRIDLIEIVGAQLETLYHLNARTTYGGLRSLLEDRRVSFTFADARASIRMRGERYDLIEADALRPTSAYAGNLYSVEYFRLLAAHLRPGGFAVTWAPTPRVIDTFRQVFPDALLYEQSGVAVLIGSDRPVRWDAAAVRERLTAPFARAYYGRAGIDIGAYLAAFARATPREFRAPAGTVADVNLDLFPRDEFRVPRRR